MDIRFRGLNGAIVRRFVLEHLLTLYVEGAIDQVMDRNTVGEHVCTCLPWPADSLCEGCQRQRPRQTGETTLRSCRPARRRRLVGEVRDMIAGMPTPARARVAPCEGDGVGRPTRDIRVGEPQALVVRPVGGDLGQDGHVGLGHGSRPHGVQSGVAPPADVRDLRFEFVLVVLVGPIA